MKYIEHLETDLLKKEKQNKELYRDRKEKERLKKVLLKKEEKLKEWEEKDKKKVFCPQKIRVKSPPMKNLQDIIFL